MDDDNRGALVVLPKEFGHWPAVFKRFAQWSTISAWENLFDSLAKDIDKESSMTGSSYVKRHQHGCGAQGNQYSQAIGRSKGGLTTKMNAVVDGLGNPIHINMTGGSVHDIVPSYELVSGMETDLFLADRAYDADRLIKFFELKGFRVVIPSKTKRKVQKKLINLFSKNGIRRNVSFQK